MISIDMHHTFNNSKVLTRSVHIPRVFGGRQFRYHRFRLVGQTPLLEIFVLLRSQNKIQIAS